MKKRLLSVLCMASVFLFLLTASIGLPIYIRPFYYAHIDAYELEERSGFTEAQIRQAYDEVLDYLTLPGKQFGTGVMACSHEAAHHFADCRVLFDLNAVVLTGSGAVLVLLLLMRRKWGPYRLGKRSAAFWAAVLALAAPMIIGALAAIDFDRAFVIFHSIFFPGKTNWIFDWNADQIIRVLPQEFFRNCAILIGGGLVTMAGGILVWENRKK
ncbi:MAG: TIGR01906 family membrane protein [Oscillospiraceae bacterium]|nr:TIGR01906 family membrane protein [Oscillospiraceae bacterium]